MRNETLLEIVRGGLRRALDLADVVVARSDGRNPARRSDRCAARSLAACGTGSTASGSAGTSSGTEMPVDSPSYPQAPRPCARPASCSCAADQKFQAGSNRSIDTPRRAPRPPEFLRVERALRRARDFVERDAEMPAQDHRQHVARHRIAPMHRGGDHRGQQFAARRGVVARKHVGRIVRHGEAGIERGLPRPERRSCCARRTPRTRGRTYRPAARSARGNARASSGIRPCPVRQQPRLHLGRAPGPARDALEIGADHVRGRVLQPPLRELRDVVDEVVVHAERRLRSRAPCAALPRRAGRRRMPSRWQSSPPRAQARCSPTASAASRRPAATGLQNRAAF